MATKENYSVEAVERAKSMYADLGNDGIPSIAEALGKTVRSIRAKLVREGVYIAASKPVKAAKDEGPTKKELVSELLGLVPGFPVDGLMAANKDAIVAVIGLAKVAASGADESVDSEEETEAA